MGLQFPERTAGRVRLRHSSLLVVLLGAALVATGCSEEGKRLGMPEPATEQGESILALWQGAWIAALATGVLVWGLIFYVSWRYRRRSADEIPVQTRYNLPLEIFYTVFPIIMVVVFFAQTVRVQGIVLDDTTPDNEIVVVGQQWQWTFNYPGAAGESNVYEFGTGNNIPTLVVPVGETTRFELHSPDVIHSFGVPGFLMKMDVIPGRTNSFQVTPKTEGTYKGKCYELCGAYHSRMLFDVDVLSREAYDQYLEELAAVGNVSEEPILGGRHARTQVGLDTEEGAQ